MENLALPLPSVSVTWMENYRNKRVTATQEGSLYSLCCSWYSFFKLKHFPWERTCTKVMSTYKITCEILMYLICEYRKLVGRHHCTSASQDFHLREFMCCSVNMSSHKQGSCSTVRLTTCTTVTLDVWKKWRQKTKVHWAQNSFNCTLINQRAMSHIKSSLWQSADDSFIIDISSIRGQQLPSCQSVFTTYKMGSWNQNLLLTKQACKSLVTSPSIKDLRNQVHLLAAVGAPFQQVTHATFSGTTTV